MLSRIPWVMQGRPLFVIALMVIAVNLLVFSAVGHSLYWALCSVLLLLVAVGLGEAFGGRG